MNGALLDTQAFIWWIMNSDRLSRTSVEAIADEDRHIYLSAVSVWEIAIKIGLEKLEFEDLGDRPLAGYVRTAMKLNGFEARGVTIDHAAAVRDLPLHHRDPFDRLLIAQATVEKLPVITNDRAFAAYDIETIW